ncbi:alpha/beta fold hydrolase [Aestuariispira ectoiniformans]|uniref:alpha/beta fold hydrolase n=1 Tax=Aestuariispira ectoiniformans TaxID=2775080 RepID=UPI00223AE050|nr:lysophospholipase [Aestuariispira ectoiniformans]
MRHSIILLCWFFVLAGCEVSRSDFFPPGPTVDQNQAFQIADPARKIVVIYNHGTARVDRPSACNKRDTPEIWRDLTGETIAGRTVYVYYLCSDVFGDDYIYHRAEEIEAALDLFRAKGVPAAQLFLAGQSAGAWSSMVVARKAPQKFNAIIATAPAFAGHWQGRSADLQAWQDFEISEIKKMTQMKALIYAFEGDAYNRPRDLVFLADIPGVDFETLSWRAINGTACESRPAKAHSTARRHCFTVTQMARIKAYIAESVGRVAAVTSLK